MGWAKPVPRSPMLMRFILLAALVMLVVGVAGQSGFFERFTASTISESGGTVSRRSVTNAPAAASGVRSPVGSVVLDAGAGGHFFVDATVSGRSVRFMVDTGASLVVLSAETARRLDIRPTAAAFSGVSRTANGAVRFAPVRLGDIRIGAIRLAGVDAAVLPEGASDIDLLGMSFLGRLGGFRSDGRIMVLSP